MNYLDKFIINDILLKETSKTGFLFEQEEDKAPEGETPDVKPEDTETKKEDTPITAISIFNDNYELIAQILWRFLSNNRRAQVDKIFYDALKENQVYVSDLNVKDEEFAQKLKDSALGKKLSKKQTQQTSQQNQQEEPVVDNKQKTNEPPFAQDFASYMPNVDNILQEAILKSAAQMLAGYEPVKIKESMINAKSIYNNCVLILLVEFYLSSVMNAFKKQKGIKEEDEDIDLSAIKDIEIRNLATELEIDTRTLRDYVELFREKRDKERIAQKTSNDLKRIDELEKELKRSRFSKIRPEMLFRMGLVKDQESVQESVIVQEGILSNIATIFKSRFKVIDLSQVKFDKFKSYVEYLFMNKQFFIQQNKMLTTYLTQHSRFSIGEKFYKSLAEFNTLSDAQKRKLTSSLFQENSEDLERGFEIIKPAIKILAENISNELIKEIDSKKSGAFKAGLKVGDWIKRATSGQMQTRPIGQGQLNQSENM